MARVATGHGVAVAVCYDNAMRAYCGGGRWSGSLVVLLMAVVVGLTACAAKKKPRTSCGLSRTNDSLRRWYAKYEGNPQLLSLTVERMLGSATAAVSKAMTSGGIDTRPNPANSRMAYRTAKCHLTGGDWDPGLRYLYLALAVLPRTPAHERQRLAIVLGLAQGLYELKAYRASVLYAMYYRQRPQATRAGKGDATTLLGKLHKKLLWSSYMATYGAAVSGLPLAKVFGVGKRRRSSFHDAERSKELLQKYERSPTLLRRDVERRLRRKIRKVAGSRCRGYSAEMRRAFSKALLKRLRWGGSGERSRTSIRALLLLLACLPPEPRYTRNRLNAVFLLAQSHGELYDNRASALYYLYFLVHTGNAGEHRSQRETALKQYRKRRSDFGLTGKLVLATDKGKVGAGIRCPFPRPR